jgi:hypothetical protein
VSIIDPHKARRVVVYLAPEAVERDEDAAGLIAAAVDKELDRLGKTDGCVVEWVAADGRVLQAMEGGVREFKMTPFFQVIDWLIKERRYQTSKWDYEGSNGDRAEEGLAEDSWYWNNGVLNYTGRVRLFGVTEPLGLQALLKLAATIVSMPEHLLHAGKITELPRPGLSSGNLE